MIYPAVGTSGVFSLTVWVLDVDHRKELHQSHTLPLSRTATLEWIGCATLTILYLRT